jgi:phosphate transport system substrate-binding protein
MKRFVAVIVAMMVGAGLCGGAYAGDKSAIQIKGSDTLLKLVQRLAEEFMKKNPGKKVAVVGGGSGTGIAALINNKCDIADASRLMKTKEVSRATAKGVNVKRVIVAMDGVSVVVHKDNPLEKLTLEQAGKLYRGEVTNWKDVGGPDMKVTLYGRQSNSGTFVYFREWVLRGDYSLKMMRMNGNAQIIEAIKKDKSGVGYVGVGYAKGVKGIKVLKVARKSGAEYYSPLDGEAVKTGKYPITRPLNQYLNGDPKGLVKAFISFELSEEGQKIVEKEGFFAIPKEYVEINKALGL